MDRKLAQRAAAAAHAGELNAVRAAVAQDGAVARYWSVLMNACFGGHHDVAAFLIAEGADVNVQSLNAHRYRPLHRTVEHKKTMPKTPGHTATVRLLLEHGADPMLRGSWNLHSAVAVAALGCTEFLPLLLERAPGEPDPYTAAVLARHADLAAILAETPAAATRPDADSRDGSWVPLQYCAPLRCRKRTGPRGHGRAAARPRRRSFVSVGLCVLVRQRWSGGVAAGSRRAPERRRYRQPPGLRRSGRRARLAAAPRRHRHERHPRHRPPRRLQPARLRGQHAQPQGRYLVPGPWLRPQQRAQQERRNRSPRRRQLRRRRTPWCACW